MAGMLIFQTVTGRLVTPETDVSAGTSTFPQAQPVLTHG
jgi:hypothetical protein